MKWTETQREEVISQAMDIAANVDRFRQVLILTMTHDGCLNVCQKRTDDATTMETIGIYRLMAADTEKQSIENWVYNPNPHSEGE